ncbi:DUF1045 domain-containing protein [Ottowia caeni]|uniref:DUF1045 domain-containing protein n=1 Tax=Ottowia caeni TaxID=2870339 RepID=UPI001E4E35A9|nr:DUF1045 domain-containing protein [Ottowia caeni]
MVNNMHVPHRVALYYAPAVESAWWRAGSSWLGRCAATGLSITQPQVEGCTSESFERLTSDPRRYGWHGTLRAPFRLAEGKSLEDVRAATRLLCAERKGFELAPLQVSRLGGFLALRPSQSQPELDRLASDCVRQMHRLAAPLSEDEIARRRRAALSAEQKELLQTWGYPYVFGQFRFHLSLTGPLQDLPEDTQALLIEKANAHFHELPACRVDRVSLFVEPAPGAHFRLLEQIEFSYE